MSFWSTEASYQPKRSRFRCLRLPLSSQKHHPPPRKITNDLQHQENQIQELLKENSLHLLTFRPEVEGIE